LELLDFKSNCNKGRCLRKTIKSKNCLKEYKQDDCYKKYNKQVEKNKPVTDEKWEEVKSFVLERDKECLLFNILSVEEKKYLLKEQKDFTWLNKKNVDCAHILSRSQYPKYIYVCDNIFLLGRLFHSRLDTYKNPLTGENISSEERDKWFERIMIDNKYWEKNMTIEKFKEILKEDNL